MIKIKNLLLLLIFNTLYFSSLYAHENKNEILWFQHLRPPWMINSGEYQNQGYGDKIREVIESKLSNYTHTKMPINAARFYKEINKHDNICYGPVIKLPTIIESFYWSRKIYAMPSMSIIVLNDTFKNLGSPTEISIEKLLQNKNYTYGNIAQMNNLPFDINKYKHQSNITTISTANSTSSLLSMLHKKRVDWMYDFAGFIKWHNNILEKKEFNNYKTIKATESSKSPTIVGYFACSKNKCGKKVIQEINQVLTKENILKMRQYPREWQLDENNLNEFDRLNLKLFGF